MFEFNWSKHRKMLHSKIAFVFSFKNLNTSPGVLNNLGLFCKITCQLDCQNAEYRRVQNISPFFLWSGYRWWAIPVFYALNVPISTGNLEQGSCREWISSVAWKSNCFLEDALFPAIVHFLARCCAFAVRKMRCYSSVRLLFVNLFTV